MVNKVMNAEVLKYCLDMKQQKPLLKFKGECYHFENRTEYVTENYTEQTETGPKEKTRTLVKTSQVKVITDIVSENFQYSASEDQTPMISGDILSHDLIKIVFRKEYSFGSPQVKESYDTSLQFFIMKHRPKDICFQYQEVFEIPGFKSHMFSMNGERHSAFVSTWAFLFCSLVLLASWPYRVCVESLCYRGKFVVKKLIF